MACDAWRIGQRRGVAVVPRCGIELLRSIGLTKGHRRGAPLLLIGSAIGYAHRLAVTHGFCCAPPDLWLLAIGSNLEMLS